MPNERSTVRLSIVLGVRRRRGVQSSKLLHRPCPPYTAAQRFQHVLPGSDCTLVSDHDGLSTLYGIARTGARYGYAMRAVAGGRKLRLMIRGSDGLRACLAVAVGIMPTQTIILTIPHTHS